MYSWDSKKSLKENAYKNKISYGAMAAYKRRHHLNGVQFKDRRLKTLWKRTVIKFLYHKGFTYEDIGRLFMMRLESVHHLRQQ